MDGPHVLPASDYAFHSSFRATEVDSEPSTSVEAYMRPWLLGKAETIYGYFRAQI